MDQRSGLSNKALDSVQLIYYKSKIHIPITLHRRVLYWCHIFLEHPGGSTISKRIQEVCYWKGFVTQTDMWNNSFRIWEQFKYKKTLYGYLPPNNAAEIKLWYMVHVDLILPYSKSIRQQEKVGCNINNDVSLTCMTMIDTNMDWFKISKVLKFDLDGITGGSNEYIKSEKSVKPIN